MLGSRNVGYNPRGNMALDKPGSGDVTVTVNINEPGLIIHKAGS